MFRLEHRSALSKVDLPIVATFYIRKGYKEMGKKVMGSHGSNSMWIEEGDAYVLSLVEFVYSSHKTRSKLNSTVIMAYSARAILKNVPARRKKGLIGSGYALMIFLAACCADEKLEREERGKDENIHLYKSTSSMQSDSTVEE